LLILVILLASGTPASSQPSAQGSTQGAPQDEQLAAKRKEKAARLEPYQVPEGERRVHAIEEMQFPSNIFVKGFHGLHPAIGGMPPGSGLVGGVGYTYGLEHEPVRVQANARISTRGFTQIDTRFEYPPRQNAPLLRLFAEARHQDYVQLRFFGLGNDARGDRSTFGELTRSAGGGLIVETDRRLQMTAGFTRIRAETDAGTGVRPLDTIYPLPMAPGFGTMTDYNVYGGRIRVDLTGQWTVPPKGVTVTVESWRYDDTSSDRFDFIRAVGEVTAQMPLGYHSRRIAVRLRTSHASPDAGGVVPFHLMEPIGGANTLRGFREYRFRDNRYLLLNAEYRWEVWTYTSFALFFDAGKVFAHSRDLDFNNMHTGYGVGLRMHTPGPTYFNIDLARSQEGFKLHVGGGPRF
jgi:outer membrane protein assembly factor BamA